VEALDDDDISEAIKPFVKCGEKNRDDEKMAVSGFTAFTSCTDILNNDRSSRYVNDLL
jgi:hypothetical protein